ncbi:hypothetical protein [Clostridium sp. LP20]
MTIKWYGGKGELGLIAVLSCATWGGEDLWEAYLVSGCVTMGQGGS